MSTLLELQRGFRRALLDGEDTGIQDLILGDGLGVTERIDVYRNNVVSSLTEALAEAYPATRRLVDPRFFAYAAHEFLTRHPPDRPCLAEYGAQFPDFIAAFEPCRHLVYLAGVARLEWLVHKAAYAPDAVSLAATVLESFAPEETPRLVFGFHPSFDYVESPWPIERIWSANRNTGGEEEIDLRAGGVHLEISRAANGVVLRTLDQASFKFRSGLHHACTLESAARSAFMVDTAFDLDAALIDLFRVGCIVDIGLAEPGEGGTQ